jgi:hypothetical protein
MPHPAATCDCYSACFDGRIANATYLRRVYVATVTHFYIQFNTRGELLREGAPSRIKTYKLKKGDKNENEFYSLKAQRDVFIASSVCVCAIKRGAVL